MTKKQKAGRPPPPATEASKIQIAAILEKFRASKEEVYTFEPGLSNKERAVVHQLCAKMGMSSKSNGGGKDRRVCVRKIKKKKDYSEGKEKLSTFTFSKEAKFVLQDLFTKHPPDGRDMIKQMAEKHNVKSEKNRGQRDDMFCKPSMDKFEIARKVESLASMIEKSSDLRQINEQRAKLPIATFRDSIISKVESNQVVLISGATGCGKTTQVPQYLLDYMWGRGETCKIICTQPRRISATSVAERISSERGEYVGESVGYKIRLEAKGGRQSSIVFCTNGILLRVLVGKSKGEVKEGPSNKPVKDELSEITHIIVDEIHDRDRFSDFMLAILREMLPSYPNLRLILMSATLDAERFSEYFGGAPIIRCPGFTYPVRSFYLDDILPILNASGNNHLDIATEEATIGESELTEDYKVALDEAIDLALSGDEFDTLLDLVSSETTPKVFNYQHSLSGVTPLMVFAGKGRLGNVCMLLSFGANCHTQAGDGTTALQWAERENQLEIAAVIKKHMEKGPSESGEEQELLNKYLSNSNSEMVDYVLIEKLMRKICTDSTDGAILVFLTGWDDISKTKEKLLASPFFKDPSKFLILSLHSMVPSVEQKKVFSRPLPGCRKIILSTNISETAITIDDVVYVIDSGRMKEKSYDPYNNVSTLQSSWVSKANARQREGRAGRCQSGICYHLYTKARAESLADFQVPEIKRMPIEELCLQVKLIDPSCRIADFLHKTLDPPVSEAITNAITVLQDIGAMTADEQLTDLGKKLGSLPVHPLVCKMLFVSILLGCLDPALTLACASDFKDPFTIPMSFADKKKAAAAKMELASLFGGNSDQLAIVAAFECWKNAKEKGQEAFFCSEYFVSASSMSMLSRMRKQLKKELSRQGFVREDVLKYSVNALDPGIISAVIVSGLYPMVGRLLPPLKNGKRFLIETVTGNKVALHTHSLNFRLTFKVARKHPLVIYDEITRGDGGMHIRNSTVIGPLPLLLLATDIVVAPVGGVDYGGDGDSDFEDEANQSKRAIEEKEDKIMSSPDNVVKVVVDRWLPFKATALDVAQIYCLRERLSAAILHKVKYPWRDLPPHLESSMHALARILSHDGLSGVCLSQLESVESKVAYVTETGQPVPESERMREQVGSRPDGFLHSLVFNRKPPQNPPYNGGLNGSSGSNPNQRRSSQGPGGAGRGSFGPAGPRRGSFKRQRGYKS